jgi:hypothetical protein
LGPKLDGEAADTPSSLQLRAASLRKLPETAKRVETHVSHRKQKTGHQSTRDSFHPNSRSIFHRTASAGGMPALPRRTPSNPCDNLLMVEAPGFNSAKERRCHPLYLSRWLTRAKCPSSNIQPLISNLENLIGTPERLETPVSHRKQTFGYTSNRYRSRVTSCVEF